jgi:hypothetical protein
MNVDSRSPVLASTTTKPAATELVIQRLRPLSTQPLPSGSAWVATAAGDRSDDAAGSDVAKAPTVSPRTRGASHRSFCSGLPWLTALPARMQCTSKIAAMLFE